jgi:shikimate dehydrogenase
MAIEEVTFVNGKTQIFGIIGDPIEQVRSPEMFTTIFVERGVNAIMLPIHVRPADFDSVVPNLKKIPNLGGLVFTIPYKGRACAFADELGAQARVAGVINALGRGADGVWRGDIFDGLGCVEAFRRRGQSFKGKSVMLIGSGGAGSAIAVAVAYEGPRALRIHDVDTAKAEALAQRVRGVDKSIAVDIGPVKLDAIDILMNASPVGMLTDARTPFEVTSLPKPLIVFDAIVKPETTPLLQLAEKAGCMTIRGREMMNGQVAKMVDFFGHPAKA